MNHISYFLLDRPILILGKQIDYGNQNNFSSLQDIEDIVQHQQYPIWLTFGHIFNSIPHTLLLSKGQFLFEICYNIN